MMSQQTDFGFQWGPAQVVRICCDERLGWVAIEVKSKKEIIDLVVLKGGKIKVTRKKKDGSCSTE